MSDYYILVHCRGFIGDILFASSLAKKLKEKYPGCHVTYRIPLPQPRLLLEQNPYIDRVDYEGDKSYGALWWKEIINIPEVDQRYPATVYFQACAGIENQSTEFDVWTVPEYDEWAKKILEGFGSWHGQYGRKSQGVPFIAYQMDWSWKAYQCTKWTLTQGEGAPHRDMDSIIEKLRTVDNNKYELIPVGFNRDKSSTHPDTQNAEDFAKTASIIKHCDWFIGSEGGLSNLAAAVGTKCIITTDFIYQNYGPNGRLKKIEFPMMGPQVYYPDAGHVHLDPCLTDEEVFKQLMYNIDNERTN